MKKNAQEMVKKIAAIIQRIYGKKGSFIYRVAVPFASKIWGAKEATVATKKILMRKQRPYLRAVIKCHKYLEVPPLPRKANYNHYANNHIGKEKLKRSECLIMAIIIQILRTPSCRNENHMTVYVDGSQGNIMAFGKIIYNT